MKEAPPLTHTLSLFSPDDSYFFYLLIFTSQIHTQYTDRVRLHIAVSHATPITFIKCSLTLCSAVDVSTAQIGFQWILDTVIQSFSLTPVSLLCLLFCLADHTQNLSHCTPSLWSTLQSVSSHDVQRSK